MSEGCSCRGFALPVAASASVVDTSGGGWARQPDAEEVAFRALEEAWGDIAAGTAGTAARLGAEAVERFRRKLLAGEICTRPFWRGEWDELEAVKNGRGEAFAEYRVELERQAEDPFREGPFDRVWCGFDRRRPQTKFGLQFGDRFVEGELHPDVGERPGDWQRTEALLLDGMVDQLWPLEPFPEPAGWDPADGRVGRLIDDLRQMFDKVQVTEGKRLDYVVIDPSVLPGNHDEGRDGLGKLYLRVPPTAIPDLAPAPVAGAPVATLFGYKVYRRHDLPPTWPELVPNLAP